MIVIAPSNERMARMIGYTGDTCKMRGQCIETTKNIVCDCPFSGAVWISIPGARRSMQNSNSFVQDWIKGWFTDGLSSLDEDWIVKMSNTA